MRISVNSIIPSVALSFFIAVHAPVLHADNSTSIVMKQLTVLKVPGFKDAGGLVRDAQSDPLNVQLTRGIAAYLESHANNRYTVVVGSPKASRLQLPAVAYELQGDLSHTETDSADGGPYVFVLRLYLEGTTPKLVNQWAGLAKTYLDISANVTHNAAVSEEGLIGGLCARVISAITEGPAVDQSGEFAKLVKTSSQFSRITADVVPVAQWTGPFAPKLHSGGQYRVKVTSEDNGAVYLVGVAADGTPSSLFVPDDASKIDVAAGRPAIVPADPPLLTGEVDAPIDKRIVVLVRRTILAADAGDAQGPSTAAVPRKIDLIYAGGLAQPTSQRPPVEILDGGPSPRQLVVDADVSRLLAMAAKDPPGTWMAKTITVHIDPETPAPTLTPAPK